MARNNLPAKPGADKYTPDEWQAHLETWRVKVAADPWAGWKSLLGSGEAPVIEEEPYQGFYRDRSQDGTYRPVAIWYDGGDLFCSIGGNLIGEREARKRWTFFAKRPISHALYKAVAENGQPWPDMDENLSNELARKPSNDGPALDSWEAISEQVEAAYKGVDTYAKIETAEQLEQSQSLRARLLELKNKADGQREKIGRPHYDEYKRVNEQWNPVVKKAEGGANAIRKAQEDFQTRQRAAERQRLEEEQKRIAEEAAKARPPQASNEPPPPEATPPAPVVSQPAMPAPIRGGYGRAAATRFVDTVTGITDPLALFQFIIGAEEPAGSKQYPRMHPEMKDFLIQLAQRAVNAKLTPPGVTIEEKAKVS